VGFKTAKIASELGIKTKTVHYHFCNMRKKLNVHKTDQILSYNCDSNEENILLDLSPRMKQIFKYILDGYSSHKIAITLGISVRTIKSYKEQMLIKNSCSSIRELIAKHYTGLKSSDTSKPNA